MLLPIHIAAGGLAIVLGAVALSVKKGGTIHRRSGLLFVYAMLVMGTSASILGLRKGGLTDGNVMGGLLTLYFVGTALTTVRPVSRWTRVINLVALTVAGTLALFLIGEGVKMSTLPGLAPDGVPFRTLGVTSIILASVPLLAAVGDVRIVRSGMPRGGPRLARHLWRMCFALFIAAGSFFSIRERVAKILPEPLTTGPMRALPILLLFGAMFYWLWRVRRRRECHTVSSPLLLAAVPLTPPRLGVRARRRQQRLGAPAGDGEACRDDGALQAGFNRKPGKVRQDEPGAERIAGASLIDDGRRASVPRVKALVTRVEQDAAARAALEDDEAEAAADEARKGPPRIGMRAVEQELVLAREERVGVRQGLPPLVERLLGDRPVRIDGDERRRGPRSAASRARCTSNGIGER